MSYNAKRRMDENENYLNFVNRRPDIDYLKLGIFVDEFKRLNYTYVESPWIVSQNLANEVSSKKRTPRFHTCIAHSGELVGSAEQGIVSLFSEDMRESNGKYTHGNYVGVSPCFRDEITIDEVHYFTFMKIELITYFKDVLLTKDIIHSVINEHIANVKNLCIKHFKVDADKFSIEPTTGEFNRDLMYDGIEIGSYGFKTYKDIKYVYGTGLALPRAEIVFNGKD